MSSEAIPLIKARKLSITAAASLMSRETHLSVDYEKVLYAARDAGATRWQLHETSLHFSDETANPKLGLGVLDGCDLATKNMRRQQRQAAHAENEGIHPVQFGEVYAIAVNVPKPSMIRSEVYASVRSYADGVIDIHQIEGLSDEDLLASVVLGHEMRHVGQWNARNRIVTALSAGLLGPLAMGLDPEAYAYTAHCLERGPNNPWLGTIQFGQAA